MEHLSGTELMIGGTLNISCDARGPGNVSIDWLHNSEIVNKSLYYGNNLIINNVMMSHSGNYTCVASNLYGKSYTFGFIQIHSKYCRIYAIYCTVKYMLYTVL